MKEEGKSKEEIDAMINFYKEKKAEFIDFR